MYDSGVAICHEFARWYTSEEKNWKHKKNIIVKNAGMRCSHQPHNNKVSGREDNNKERDGPGLALGNNEKNTDKTGFAEEWPSRSICCHRYSILNIYIYIYVYLCIYDTSSCINKSCRSITSWGLERRALENERERLPMGRRF